MTRPALLLVSGILLANGLVFLLNVFLLPQVAPPERRGGIRVNWHQPRRDAMDPRIESHVREIVRSEMRPNQDSSTELAVASRPISDTSLHGGVPRGVVRGQGPDTEPPRTRRGQELRRLLLPFGVLREVGGGVGLYLTSLVTFIAVCAGAIFLAPARMKAAREAIHRDAYNMVRLGLIGFLGYLSILALCIMLAATVVGIPLAVLILLGLAPVTVAGLASVGLALGGSLRRAAQVEVASPVYDLLIGLLVLFPGGLIPYLGWLVAGTTASLGFGAVLVTKLGSRDSWSLQILEET